MTKDDKIIYSVFQNAVGSAGLEVGGIETPWDCAKRGLCYGAHDPQHSGCKPCRKKSTKAGWSNMSASTSDNLCIPVGEVIDGDAYNKCYEASSGCGDDKACNDLAKKYAEALKGGYDKSFTRFKNNARNLGLLNQGLDFLSGFLNKDNDSGAYNSGGYTPDDEDKGMSTGAKVGIGIGVVAVIGTILYFSLRKK